MREERGARKGAETEKDFPANQGGKNLGMATQKSGQKKRNNVKMLREQQLMSKAELARKAGISALTVGRVEEGKSCRMDTKRKIILALGLKLTDKHRVFAD